jgi:hypothetical protein
MNSFWIGEKITENVYTYDPTHLYLSRSWSWYLPSLLCFLLLLVADSGIEYLLHRCVSLCNIYSAGVLDTRLGEYALAILSLKGMSHATPQTPLTIHLALSSKELQPLKQYDLCISAKSTSPCKFCPWMPYSRTVRVRLRALPMPETSGSGGIEHTSDDMVVRSEQCLCNVVYTSCLFFV